MKDKVHIMVDIETLGKKDNATIFQISAMSFDIVNGQIKDTVDLKLDIKKVDDLQVDGDTLLWWLNTNKELLTELLNDGNLTESEMFKQFNSWILKQDVYEKVVLWGNGIIFDNAKLKQKLEDLKIGYPIHYKNDRDVRTILALASDKSGMTEGEIKEAVSNKDEVEHNALDDVRYQIRLVSYCYNLLIDNK